MIDVVSIGDDMGYFNTETVRAKNILSIQVGALEYAPDLGIDLRYFLSEDFRFMNSSFRSYLIEVLANQGINVASVAETINNLYSKYTFEISADDTSAGSLVAR